MVRLKREIEGIRPNRAVPVPPYALQPDVSASVLPWLDTQVRSHEPGRVLLAGTPRPDLAVALARDGHWVTLSDLDDEAMARLHARLEPRIAGRLTLVNRSYGDASFAPSSFDLVVLSDALHMYLEPVWLVHKAARELKADGHFVARALVTGDLADCSDCGLPPSAAEGAHVSGLESAALQVLAQLEAALRGPAAALVANGRAREAVARGAHLQAERFAPQVGAVTEAIGAVLSIEHVCVGHTLRLRLGDALYGVRSPLRRALFEALRRLPEQARAADRARKGPRLLGILARKALTRRPVVEVPGWHSGGD